MSEYRKQPADCRRLVIKIGSALVTNDGRGLDVGAIADWVEQMVRLQDDGRELVLVSSGAVAEGMNRLGWKRRPHALNELQAAAAVGQMGLVQAYESRFQLHARHTAQVLLTHDDLADRQRYLNARSTLRALLKLGIVPVVNENDTVTTEEIRFGDNDTLAALVTNLVEADLLILLTDQAGLFEGDPRDNPDAQLIQDAEAEDPVLESMASAKGGGYGLGGMLSKVRAAKRAARSGASTIIASGRESRILERIVDNERLGTHLYPAREPLLARKQWLAGHLQVRGRLTLDAGAVRVLRESGGSLLSVGVTEIKGHFARGEVVACYGPQGEEVARGLVNYNAGDSRKIMGQPTRKIESLLGYIDEPELIHRDNLVLL